MSKPKAVVEQPERMTIEELKATPPFQVLSLKQMAFVLNLVSSYRETGNFDPAAAVQHAYNCRTPEIANRFSYQLLAHPKIIAAIDRALGHEITLPRVFSKAIERATVKGRLDAHQLRELRSVARNGGDAIARAVLIRETQKQLHAAEPGSTSAKDLLYLLKELIDESLPPKPAPEPISKHTLNRRAKAEEAEAARKKRQVEEARRDDFGFEA